MCAWLCAALSLVDPRLRGARALACAAAPRQALVHTTPSSIGGAPPRDYLVEFEDESEASGKSEPMRVPQKYVIRAP
jgi:hypothetical protein